MAKTLFDCTYQLARHLGILSEGVATNGSTTTIVDTVERVEADDLWNGGTAWITYDAGGAGAAPQGEYSYISDFVQSTGTITLRSTLTAAVAANDRYGVARPRYPLQILIQKINEAVGGVIEKTDTSTVVIAADQTEYSLPANVLDLKQVWIAADDDTNANGWQKLYDYDVEKSVTGTADKLIFSHQYLADTAIKLVYLTYHDTLRLSTDKLDDSIHIMKVIANAAVGCLIWRKAKVGESDTSINDMLNFYQNLAAQYNAEFASTLPKKSAKTISFNFDRP